MGPNCTWRHREWVDVIERAATTSCGVSGTTVEGRSISSDVFLPQSGPYLPASVWSAASSFPQPLCQTITQS